MFVDACFNPERLDMCCAFSICCSGHSAFFAKVLIRVVYAGRPLQNMPPEDAFVPSGVAGHTRGPPVGNPRLGVRRAGKKSRSRSAGSSARSLTRSTEEVRLRSREMGCMRAPLPFLGGYSCGAADISWHRYTTTHIRPSVPFPWHPQGKAQHSGHPRRDSRPN